MPTRQQIKLHFGPYRTPRFRYGSIIYDEKRGDVRIVALSNSRIPWPIGKRGFGRSLVLYQGLARAVRQESATAVSYWWGISRQAVWRLRRALDVPANNPGTAKLRTSYGHAPWMEHARRNSHARAGELSRRATIAMSKIGKPRPRYVLEAMRRGRRRNSLSAAHRHKISQALKHRIARPWAAWEDSLLLLPARDIIAQTGRSLSSIRQRRRERIDSLILKR